MKNAPQFVVRETERLLARSTTDPETVGTPLIYSGASVSAKWAGPRAGGGARREGGGEGAGEGGRADGREG